MNITFLVNRDLHANRALNLLRPLFDVHKVTIFLSEKVGLPKPGWTSCEALHQLKFIEQQLFNGVIIPLAEKQSDKAMRFLSFDELGQLGNGCSVLENINTADGLAQFKASEPALVISIRFGKIIKDPVLAIPKYGVLNLHSGLLPEYQGIMTTLHAINAGESQIGCTLHYIDSGEIDTGDIIKTESLPVNMEQSLFWHVSQLYPLGCNMIEEAVNRLHAGKQLQCYSQDVHKQQYFGLPESVHFEQLLRSGFTIWRPEDVLTLLHHFQVKEGIDMTSMATE